MFLFRHSAGAKKTASLQYAKLKGLHSVALETPRLFARKPKCAQIRKLLVATQDVTINVRTFRNKDFYGRCPEGIGRHNVKMSFCPFTFSRPLIGQKRERYIVEEVIEVDELDKDNISAALGKQDE